MSKKKPTHSIVPWLILGKTKTRFKNYQPDKNKLPNQNEVVETTTLFQNSKNITFTSDEVLLIDSSINNNNETSDAFKKSPRFQHLKKKTYAARGQSSSQHLNSSSQRFFSTADNEVPHKKLPEIQSDITALERSDSLISIGREEFFNNDDETIPHECEDVLVASQIDPSIVAPKALKEQVNDYCIRRDSFNSAGIMLFPGKISDKKALRTITSGKQQLIDAIKQNEPPYQPIVQSNVENTFTQSLRNGNLCAQRFSTFLEKKGFDFKTGTMIENSIP